MKKLKNMVKNIKLSMSVFIGLGEFVHLIFGAGFIFLLDQLFKSSIDQEPEENFPRDLPVGKGKITITRAHNTGFSQGHLSSFPAFVRQSSLALTAFVAGILPVFCVYFPGKKKVEKFGTMLLLGGAISNTYDRIAHHFVTDYLHIKIGPLKKSIINIGDIAIVGGTTIYMLGSMLSSLSDQRKSRS